jgi:hypothetical protein
MTRSTPVAQDQKPKIPQEILDAAMQNIEQAHAACTQLMDATRKAQEIMKSLAPPNPIAAGLSDVQERAMRFTQQNLDASFSLANELIKATDLAEALQIQSRHAQQQMHAYVLQAQELTGMVTDAAQKVKPGS